MADIQENSQIVSENPDLFARESNDLENHESNEETPKETSGETNGRSKIADLIKRFRSYLVGLTFVAGLLLGWIVIGWWLWPVQWTNSEPWHLRPRHQKTFIRLVAEDYWQTSDIYRAREALAGWDEEDLAELLATMENHASSPEERQHLAALAEALEMPGAAEGSLIAFLLSQKVILLSSLLSASPLVMALAFAAYSFAQSRTQQAEAIPAIEEQLEEEFEELFAQGEEAQEGRPDQEEEEQEQEEAEQAEGEGEGEEEEEGEEDKHEEEYEEDDEEEIEPWAQNLVFDLFDEEDEDIAQLKAICQNLPDIDVSELLEHARKTADDLCRGNALR
jgi:hypothetical protein